MTDAGMPGMTDGAAPITSTRDPEWLRARLESWIASRLPDGADPSVPPIATPGASGWSSETLLFDVTWADGGAERTERLVARVAPDPTAMPVFPRYDMPEQARIMGFVAEHTDLPLPTVRWIEEDASVLGERFFVMDRVDGLVPADIPPYSMGGWVLEAAESDRARLSASSARVLAALHPTRDAVADLDFLQYDWPGDSALRRHVANERHYWDWIADGRVSPRVDRIFAWLEDHWPEHEGPALLSWGDARIGNLMYRDFEPVAVLDWEMAAVGPPELDVAWMAWMHRFFESLCERYGVGGLPDLLTLDEVATIYEAETGYTPRDLDFYTVYTALRHLLITMRINLRRMHFGELVHADDLDATIDHADLIEGLLSP